MSAPFQVITPPACERDARRITRRNPELASIRLRYDIFGQDVVLYSFRDRKDVY